MQNNSPKCSFFRVATWFDFTNFITLQRNRIYLNKDWGCVILREIDFLLKICWSIPCLHPSWKVHTWIEICANLNHRKKTKADGSQLIPRKHTETLVLLSDTETSYTLVFWILGIYFLEPVARYKVEWHWLKSFLNQIFLHFGQFYFYSWRICNKQLANSTAITVTDTWTFNVFTTGLLNMVLTLRNGQIWLGIPPVVLQFICYSSTLWSAIAFSRKTFVLNMCLCCDLGSLS